MQRGELIEQIIAQFSSLFFMKDFVFIKHSYHSGRIKKKLSDILLVLKNEALVISIKGTDGSLKDAKKFIAWLEKQTWLASKEAKTNMQRLSTVNSSGINLWSESKRFHQKSLTPICGIVLLDCTQFNDSLLEYQLRLPSSRIPIHVLSINDFYNVVFQLGSIHDLVEYFRKRSEVIAYFNGVNQEQEFLAYYQMVSNSDFSHYPTSDKVALINKHNDFVEKHEAEYKKRYILMGRINQIIENLHTRDALMESFIPEDHRKFIEPPQSRKGYLLMASLLNSLPASVKTNIGNKIEEYLKNLCNSGLNGLFAFQLDLTQTLFVFHFASKSSRKDRCAILPGILHAGLYQYRLPDGLIVSMNADDPSEGFDLCIMQGVLDFDDSYKEAADRFFPDKKKVCIESSI